MARLLAATDLLGVDVLRIVAGRFRGRKLVTPATQRVRPTADRMKESVFNVLQQRVPQARLLDLYAGAGNLGLEAVSRGARQVVFVERDTQALQALRKNLAILGLSERSSGVADASAAPKLPPATRQSAVVPAKESVAVVGGDAIRFLQRYVGDPFDLILVDPPYDGDVEETVLGALQQRHVVPGGIIVFQHRDNWRLQPTPEGFELLRPRRFGKTVIDFLCRHNEREEEDV